MKRKPKYDVDTDWITPTDEQRAKFADVMVAWEAAAKRHVGRPEPLQGALVEALGLILQQMCLDETFWRQMRDITIKHDPLEVPR